MCISWTVSAVLHLLYRTYALNVRRQMTNNTAEVSYIRLLHVPQWLNDNEFFINHFSASNMTDVSCHASEATATWRFTNFVLFVLHGPDSARTITSELSDVWHRHHSHQSCWIILAISRLVQISGSRSLMKSFLIWLWMRVTTWRFHRCSSYALKWSV